MLTWRTFYSRSRLRRSGGRGTEVLPFLLHTKVTNQPHRPRRGLGASAADGRGDDSLPPDLPSDAGHGREQEADPNPLPEGGRQPRRQFLAQHRRQTGADDVAAAAGDQLGHRRQRLRLQGKRPGCDDGGVRRGRTGESGGTGEFRGGGLIYSA